MSEPINTAAIENFIQMVRSAELGNQKEIRMDIKNARLLSYTLGTVISRMHADLETIIEEMGANQTITVSMDSGNNW